MPKRPAELTIDWYPRRWKSDTACLSVAARGAWHETLMDMACTGSDCFALTDTYAGWGLRWGCLDGAGEAGRLIEELELREVCVVETALTGQVTLISRRRRRVAKEREQTNLRQRRYKERRQSNGADDAAVGSAPYEEVMSAWNKIAKTHGLPTARSLNEMRMRQLDQCWESTEWRRDWQKALAAIGAASFLLGDNDRGWKANFDWFVRPNTLHKTNSVQSILEGKYHGGRSNTAGAGRTEPGPRHFTRAGDDQQVYKDLEAADRARATGDSPQGGSA